MSFTKFNKLSILHSLTNYESLAYARFLSRQLNAEKHPERRYIYDSEFNQLR